LSPNKSAAPGPVPEEFVDPLARAADRLGVFSHRQFLWYPEVPSTNDLASALAERGAREGCAVIADAQTAGRGRHGRSWSSPAGAGLYVSAILRPPLDAVPLLTIAAGLGIAEGVKTASGLDPALKWPNDLYIGERKLAGVLAEAGSLHDEHAGPLFGQLKYVVVGFGINVMPAAHPPDVAVRATSIEGELGRSVDRGLLLTECLAGLAARYDELRHQQAERVLSAWRARAADSLGRTVEWDAGGPRRGAAVDIDRDGALVVKTEQGMERIISGEVRWI
jgi:BirA family biotin operon repressor/biotin-[acetyl-CoA-carboxylase] ligase